MDPRRRRRRRRPRGSCHCSKSLTLSSPLLFLSIILPKSSLAQLSNTATSSSTNARLTTPITFSTITTLPLSSFPKAIASSTQANPPPATTTLDPTGIDDHVFNYYFLIVIVAVVLLGALILAISRRKKRKAAQLRSHGQRALARDVEGFRARLGRGWPGTGNAGVNTRDETDDGLDERGEAPPPYVPGSRPPSLRGGDGVRPSLGSENRMGNEAELRNMNDTRAPKEPPGYHENTVSESDPAIARPATSITTSERFRSTRRLSSHQAAYLRNER